MPTSSRAKSARRRTTTKGAGASKPARVPRTSAQVLNGRVVHARDGASVPSRARKTNKKSAAKGAQRRRGTARAIARAAKGRARKRSFTARTADKHELYQLAVQSPDEDVAFLSRVYTTFRKKEARHMREDFCGTALLCATWIGRDARFTAEGFDIDPNPVAWGLEHNFAKLGDDAARATLHLKDVRARSRRRPDVRSAQNFSWFVFKDRKTLLEYCRSAYADLAKDGVFVLDIYGGPEAQHEMQEIRDIEEGFTYVWDQRSYAPANGDYRCAIHFRFKDGTKLERCFTYEWRLWSLTEMRDVLLEAGFSSVETYWEGTDEDGESGNGVYRRSTKGENCLAWVTYLIALK